MKKSIVALLFLSSFGASAHDKADYPNKCQEGTKFSSGTTKDLMILEICEFPIKDSKYEVVSIYKINGFKYNFFIDHANGDAPETIINIDFDPKIHPDKFENVILHKSKVNSVIGDMSIEFFNSKLVNFEYNKHSTRYVYIPDLSRNIWRNTKFSNSPISIQNGIFSVYSNH